MAPIIVPPDAIMAFKDGPAFEAWIARHHHTSKELYLRVYKKDSGVPTVTYAEALDSALSWGWIDGVKKSYDDQSFLQRFSPRGRKSVWSVKNREHVDRLIKAGRMQPSGLAHVEAAKEDGRWDRAYEGSSKMETPADLLAAIAAEPAALEMYGRLNSANRYAIAFRVHNLKSEAGRKKRIADFVDMLKRGETLYPNGKAAK